MRFLVIIVVVLLTACVSSTGEQLTVRKTNPALWMDDKAAIFELQANPKLVDMELIVRFDPEKNPSKKLQLVVSTTLPNRQYARDTVVVDLRDAEGNPLGKRQGGMFDVAMQYRQKSTTPKAVMKIVPVSPTVGVHFVTLKTTPAK